MREILFRGKRKDNGKWVQGSLFERPNQAYIIPLPIITSKTEVDPETVGQFTGLTANGTRIFEGDVVLVYGTDTAVVEWDETSAMFMAVFGHADGDLCSLISQYPDVEVIGNIHDNPELIGERKGND